MAYIDCDEDKKVQTHKLCKDKGDIAWSMWLLRIQIFFTHVSAEGISKHTNMTLTGKTRLTNRKLQIFFRTPKLSKASKELLDQMDMTKQLNEALLEEVKENEVAIAKLDEKEKKLVEIIKDLKQKLAILENTTKSETFIML